MFVPGVSRGTTSVSDAHVFMGKLRAGGQPSRRRCLGPGSGASARERLGGSPPKAAAARGSRGPRGARRPPGRLSGPSRPWARASAHKARHTGRGGITCGYSLAHRGFSFSMSRIDGPAAHPGLQATSHPFQVSWGLTGCPGQSPRPQWARERPILCLSLIFVHSSTCYCCHLKGSRLLPSDPKSMLFPARHRAQPSPQHKLGTEWKAGPLQAAAQRLPVLRSPCPLASGVAVWEAEAAQAPEAGWVPGPADTF